MKSANQSQRDMSLRNAAWGLEHLIPTLEQMVEDWPERTKELTDLKRVTDVVVGAAQRVGYSAVRS